MPNKRIIIKANEVVLQTGASTRGMVIDFLTAQWKARHANEKQDVSQSNAYAKKLMLWMKTFM